VFLRVLRDGAYRAHLAERFGILPRSYTRTTYDAVWFHAVSVGEVLSSLELLKKTREQLPQHALFLSCTTAAGRHVAESKLAGIVDGVFYAPFDYCSFVRRVLRRLRPSVLVVLETEIWPNLYRESKRAGCMLAVVNGRISPGTASHYRSYAWFFRHVLKLPDRILVQSGADRERFIAAGTSEERVEVAGNLKFDYNPSGPAAPESIRSWLARGGESPLWVAASTSAPMRDGDADEDDVVIAAHLQLRKQLPNLRLILAPRKPERFDAVAEKLRLAGLAAVRRSQLEPGSSEQVLLLDSVGELSSLFAFAQVVFMGGTLAARGGHNILEPAFHNSAIIAGPHMENFQDIHARFTGAGALVSIDHPAGLAPALERLVADAGERDRLGKLARRLAEAEGGATDRALRTITELRWEFVPKAVPCGLLRPLAWIWRAGGEWKRRRALRRQGRLAAPVISIGGIAMGGTGKTPVVRHLARVLHEAGHVPAVLTRGFRRQIRNKLTVIPAGQVASTDLTGDEAQMVLRDGAAHLGIAADRLAAGRALETELHPDIFLLDDGFQHARLHRDLDIVVLDGLDPFAGQALFPTGRLREPVSALRRAHAIVLTRSEGRRFDGALRLIRDVNPGVPVFFSRVVPLAWIDLVSGHRYPVDEFASRRVAAFCGLGNPASFWTTLLTLHYRPEFIQAFPDHHRYSMRDIIDVAERPGIDMLLTTEKDAMNIPDAIRSHVAPGTIAWLDIRISVERESDLFALLEQAIASRPLR
jgi:tetraacyldisaccharide 4'-kinase